MVTFESIFIPILLIGLTIILLFLMVLTGMIMYESYLDLKIWIIQKKNRLKKIKHEKNDIN